MEKYAYSSSPGSLGRRGGGDSRLQFRRVPEAWAWPTARRHWPESRLIILIILIMFINIVFTMDVMSIVVVVVHISDLAVNVCSFDQ
jgi:hypothetical protein